MNRKVDLELLRGLYQRGLIIDEICARMGVSRSAVKENLKLLDVPRRPKGWKPRGYSQKMSQIMKVVRSR